MNSPAKHTPGPWAVSGGNIIQDVRGLDVAKVWMGPRGELNDTANARLIAAAPDLLAALDGYISAVDAYYRQTPSPETIAEKCVDLVLIHERAVAAISKAKGAE